jgi:hypothetical protein
MSPCESHWSRCVRRAVERLGCLCRRRDGVTAVGDQRGASQNGSGQGQPGADPVPAVPGGQLCRNLGEQRSAGEGCGCGEGAGLDHAVAAGRGSGGPNSGGGALRGGAISWEVVRVTLARVAPFPAGPRLAMTVASVVRKVATSRSGSPRVASATSSSSMSRARGVSQTRARRRSPRSGLRVISPSRSISGEGVGHCWLLDLHPVTQLGLGEPVGLVEGQHLRELAG